MRGLPARRRGLPRSLRPSDGLGCGVREKSYDAVGAVRRSTTGALSNRLLVV